jgi:hypothetical protein
MAHRHSNAACAEANLCLNQPRRACVTTVVAVVKSFSTNSRAASGRRDRCGRLALGAVLGPRSAADFPLLLRADQPVEELPEPAKYRAAYPA